jgi:hypothetical protein
LCEDIAKRWSSTNLRRNQACQHLATNMRNKFSVALTTKLKKTASHIPEGKKKHNAYIVQKIYVQNRKII